MDKDKIIENISFGAIIILSIFLFIFLFIGVKIGINQINYYDNIVNNKNCYNEEYIDTNYCPECGRKLGK